MTKQEWRECGKPDELLKYLMKSSAHRGMTRKARLFVCACCRLVWDSLETYERKAVEIGERFADTQTTPDDLHNARDLIRLNKPAWASSDSDCVVIASASCESNSRLWDTAEQAAARVTQWRTRLALGPDAYQPNNDWRRYQARFRSELCDVLRCLFCNPLAPPRPLTPSLLTWNEGAVLKIAQTLYENRHFDELPILADALEEAGCTDREILVHLRKDGVHVRGCWVVDYLLNKPCPSNERGISMPNPEK